MEQPGATQVELGPRFCVRLAPPLFQVVLYCIFDWKYNASVSAVIVGSFVGDGVTVGVFDIVAVGVFVTDIVGVTVIVGVFVGVMDIVGVIVIVGVLDIVGVTDIVAVGDVLTVGVMDIVGVAVTLMVAVLVGVMLIVGVTLIVAVLLGVIDIVGVFVTDMVGVGVGLSCIKYTKTEFLHVGPLDVTFNAFVYEGIPESVYPEDRSSFETFMASGVQYPSASV